MLGASGTGLAGIVCTLAGAGEVVLSDYPDAGILANISVNVKKNIPVPIQSEVLVKGHEWGLLDNDFSQKYTNNFTRIIAADCLWMPHEHQALARSMHHFLSKEHRARVWVVAGFHTGRARLAPFFDVVVEEGLEVENIWERDVNGVRREWTRERDGGREDVTGRKRWLVIATLKRKRSSAGTEIPVASSPKQT